jgi:hypothetical protein
MGRDPCAWSRPAGAGAAHDRGPIGQQARAAMGRLLSLQVFTRHAVGIRVPSRGCRPSTLRTPPQEQSRTFVLRRPSPAQAGLYA